jgi:hypothetical protein
MGLPSIISVRAVCGFFAFFIKRAVKGLAFVLEKLYNISTFLKKQKYQRHFIIHYFLKESKEREKKVEKFFTISTLLSSNFLS